VQRPDTSGNCPEGTKKCSEYTSPWNTVCYENTDDCPIIDINIIDQSQKPDYQSRGYSFVDFNTTASIAYTKDSKGIDQMPPTSIRLEY